MPRTHPSPPTPERRIPLRFSSSRKVGRLETPLPHDISASAMIDRTLFVACDETSSIEQLVLTRGRFGRHRNFNLCDFFDLPNGPDGEMDIEGLSIDGGYLWICGSHSLKRDKPAPKENSREKALKELTDIKRDGNRYFLGRAPLRCDGDGVHTPLAQCDEAGERRTAACVKMKKAGNALMRALEDDPHFGPFLHVPCKENGFDIEGLAVRGERAFLGLRGPVLRGWAIILDVELQAGKAGRLKLRRRRDSKLRYAKHFIDLDGLGVRDLLLEDDDLLILAGPTMDLDGPAAVYRWRDALAAQHNSVTPRSAVQEVTPLPYGRGVDHPESMVRWRQNGHASLMVIYDSPARERMRGKNEVQADVFGSG